jgi:redox-sensitive bicupin YhaK (pirin superfamily)
MDNLVTVADAGTRNGREAQGLNLGISRQNVVDLGPRHIAFRTSGRQHGPITRLVSPSDIGELIKPFVFLDHGEIEPSGQPLFGIHPHSGIATLTVVLTGGIAYEDTTGKKGEIEAGGLEWMKAGNGVWHDGRVLMGEPMRFYQLWVALPESEENAPPESQYIRPDAVQQDGPVRVILGRFGRAASPIRAPQGIDYFHVRLNDGQRWRYTPPAGHTVAWLSVDQGRLQSPETINAGQVAVFDESGVTIEVQADGATSFVFGSAVKHPHALVLGKYSVHTNAEALLRGEAEIRRIGQQLRADGRL